MASNDMARFNALIEHLESLPMSSFDKISEQLSAKTICNKSKDERVVLWTGLSEFASKHRRFPGAEWAMRSDIISKNEGIAETLAPKKPLNLHRRLFSGRAFDLYEETDNWKVEHQKIESRRHQAIKDFLAYGGMDSVIRFA